MSAAAPPPAPRAALVLAWHPLHPPRGGAALRNWQNVRALAELGPVDVLSIGPGQGGPPPPPVRRWIHLDPTRLPAEPALRARVRRSSFWLRPRTHPWSAELERGPILRAFTELVATCELVVLEELWFHPYLDRARALGRRTVFDAHNVEARLRRELGESPSGRPVERLRARILARRVAELERDLARRADQVWCCSEEDATELRAQRGSSTGLHVVPNTVDVEHYAGVREGRIAASAVLPGPGPVIAFVGAFAYAPNEDAARLLVERILPAVQREHAGARLLLVGRDPTPWMLALARERTDVHVTGPVEDVRPYLARADVIAVPLTVGGGTRLKILEAFAAGRPVVSTPKGAEGLDVVDGEQLLLREVDELAPAIRALLADRARATSLAGRALTLVQARYATDVTERAIHAALAGLLPAPR